MAAFSVQLPTMGGENPDGLSDAAVRDTLHYKVSSIKFLFGGRFTSDEISTILVSFDGDVKKTANFFMADPAEIQKKLNAEKQSWTLVKRVKDLRKDRVRLQEAARGIINTDVRQFACKACDKAWWRRVPIRKQVSKCDRCQCRFEPVPKDKEWGIGVFTCLGCNSEFWGWIQMGHYSVCRLCGSRVFPTRILPPHERSKEQRQRQKHHHTCECCQNGAAGWCAHPQARRREGFWVLYPSNVHASSGSTVDTFLPQSDLQNPIEEVYDRISPIPEDLGEFDDGSS